MCICSKHAVQSLHVGCSFYVGAANPLQVSRFAIKKFSNPLLSSAKVDTKVCFFMVIRLSHTTYCKGGGGGGWRPLGPNV